MSTTDDELRIRRLPERGSHDRDTAYAIIDAAIVGHVGTIRDGRPLVLPMFCGRDGDRLLMHGAPASGTVRRGRDMDVCVTMTLLDGMVLARSSFHHSFNYRSVTIIGTATVIRDEADRSRALSAITEHLAPGRDAQLRPTTTEELRQTAVLELPLDRYSTKMRAGPPGDDEADYDWPVWAGVLPITTTIGEPVPDDRLDEGIDIPAHIDALTGKEL
jgi:nitroimidazol reductase NimA-like FMN-containing flavoprotein (pyridoxamine 5'-phosphate oxidase superfamily)